MTGSQDRPWSPLEVSEKMQDVYERIEDAVNALPAAKDELADAKRIEERAIAIATIDTIAQLRGDTKDAYGTNKVDAKERDAMIDQAVLDQRHKRRKVEGTYNNLSTALKAMGEQSGLLKSMHVSHRESRVDDARGR